ncbi:hypothetical protein [Psychroserpens burtonensis]|uniref:hypothetical protein n=1 Tax=Psychroserpens burtonensis TaxID=49278 RepID=UPI00040E0023|nr:hypothetical protein [Psychroserpens burtonensis]
MQLTRKNIILYLVIGGFIFYILSVLLSAISIAPIPMDQDWCKYGEDIQIGENEYEFRCLEYKNEWQETIYYYNQKVLERYINLLWFKLILALIVTVFIFYFIPKWKGVLNKKGENIIGSLILIALVIVLIIPFIFSFLLPPPIEWLPDIFEEINDAQINEAIRTLKNNH